MNKEQLENFSYRFTHEVGSKGIAQEIYKISVFFPLQNDRDTFLM